MDQQTVKESRTSGILLHVSSLPGPHGIGDLGSSAYRFIDFLKESGQTWWQTLPLGPLGYGNSPYQTLSAFAGNPLFINLELLKKEKLLSAKDLSRPTRLPKDNVDYQAVSSFKMACLQKALHKFLWARFPKEKKEFDEFIRAQKSWLTPYAIYNAIKDHHQGLPWWEWETDVRHKKPQALLQILKKLPDKILYHQFIQYLFFKQWLKLKNYANQNGISLIGDIPFYVALDSADVWSHPGIFDLDSFGNPVFVAGVPPDAFSETGQLWGNPVFKWETLKKRGYDWWLARIQHAHALFDRIRLDHFGGFFQYWSVPGNAKTAQFGRWENGPGIEFFKTLIKRIPDLDLIVEDLGTLIPEGHLTREQFQFSGMHVLQYAFETHQGAEVNRPYNIRKKSVVYTGTHDNDPLVGWVKNLALKTEETPPPIRSDRNLVFEYLNKKAGDIHWDLIRLAMMSPADTSIFPMQDVLGLGSEARLNQPGSNGNNWEWRFKESLCSKKLAAKLKILTQTYDRIPNIP